MVDCVGGGWVGVSAVGGLSGKSCTELTPLHEAAILTFLISRFESKGLVGEGGDPGGVFEGEVEAVDDIISVARTSFPGLDSLNSPLRLLFDAFVNSLSDSFFLDTFNFFLFI